jgi:hypothetical protein
LRRRNKKVFDGISPDGTKQAIANALSDFQDISIDNIMPSKLKEGKKWEDMTHDEKKEWLRNQKEGFLLPLALGKALSMKILALKPDIDPPTIAESVDAQRDLFNNGIAYSEKPAVIYKVFMDLIKGKYLGFVNLKIEESEEGKLYAYFPPDNILVDPKEIVDSFVLHGITNSPEMYAVINIVLRQIRAQSKVIRLTDINPQHLIPLGRGKVLDLNDFEIKDPENYYFTYELEYPPRHEFIEKLKRGEIDDHYFENEIWFKVIRKHYDEENWRKLKLSVGTIFAGENTDEKFNIINGDSLTRKTTLLTTLLKALKWKGQERGYLIASSLKKVSDPSYRFPLEEAIGAKAIICSEEKETILKSVDVIKKLIGGDAQSLERKFEHHRTTIISLGIFVATNDIPIFPQSIGKQDVSRKVNLIYTSNPSPWQEWEREGMRNPNFVTVMEWVIYCTWLLKNEGYRIKTDEEIDITHTELIESRTYVKEFERKGCIYGNFRITVETLFKVFDRWRIKEGKRPIGKNKFSAEIMRISAEEGRPLEKIYPRNKATFLGITVNPDFAKELGIYEEIKGELMVEKKGKLTNLEEEEEIPKGLEQYARFEKTENGILFKCTVKTERGECGVIFADPKSLIAHLEKRHGIRL